MTLKAKLNGAKRSLTIWVNGLAGALIIGLPEAQIAFPQLRDYVPHNMYHYAMGALIVANILIRFRTKTGLENK